MSPITNPVKKGVWKHWKGPLYLVIGSARDCNTQKEVVEYIPLYGDDFTTNLRSREEFEEEISIERVTHQDGKELAFPVWMSSSSVSITDRTTGPSKMVPRFTRVVISKEQSINCETGSNNENN